MFNSTYLQLFLVTCTLLIMAPGPDTLYVLARTIEHGRRAGVVSAGGICCGFLVHIAAAVIGVSALLMASSLAFTLVKYAGAAYLIYLGIRTLMARNQRLELAQLTPASRNRLFTQGFITNVLNPKVAIFFLAFVPQFIDPTKDSVAIQIITYGLIDMGLSMIWLGGIAMIAGSARQWLIQHRAFWRIQKWFTGSVLMGLGVRLLVTEPATK